MTASQVDGDNLGGYKKIGFYGGAGVGLPVSKKMLLNMQALYVQKGSRETSYGYYIWRINYLQIPVFLEYNIFKNLDARAGLGADLLINSKESYGADFTDISGSLHKFTPVFIAGAGYRLSPSLGVNLTYNYAIPSISKRFYQYTNTIAVSLSLRLNPERDTAENNSK
jgi:opacity protein-like surface antigen